LHLHLLHTITRVLMVLVLFLLVVMVGLGVMALPGRVPLGIELLLQPSFAILKVGVVTVLGLLGRALCTFLLHQWADNVDVMEQERARRDQRYRSLLRVSHRLVDVACVLVVGVWIVVDIPGVRSASTSILVAGGALLGALAFVFQSLLRDFVAGMLVLLEDRYADEPKKRHAMRLSVFRLRQLTAQLLTNAGASADPAVTARLCELRAGPAFERLESWYVLGPFYPGDASPGKALDTTFPGENNAIAGDTNPNITYKREDGKALDFRTTVTADAGGFVNLSGALTPDGPAIAYATRTIHSDTEREATLRLGVDYFMQVWVNGKIVYRLPGGHGSPKPNRHHVKIPLRSGANAITLKILAGSKGFGFWANLSTQGATPQTNEDASPVPLYPPDITYFDPYEYHYW